MLLCVGYIISIAFYNYCGMAITKSLSAIHRTLIDALRTILVWGVDLLIYYAFNSSTFGEPWTTYSPLQLGGFIFIVLGTLMYKEIFVVGANLFSAVLSRHHYSRLVSGPRQLPSRPIKQPRMTINCWSLDRLKSSTRATTCLNQVCHTNNHSIQTNMSENGIYSPAFLRNAAFKNSLKFGKTDKLSVSIVIVEPDFRT